MKAPKRRRRKHAGGSKPGDFHVCPTCVDLVMAMLDVQLAADAGAICKAFKEATGEDVDPRTFRASFQDALYEKLREGIADGIDG